VYRADFGTRLRFVLWLSFFGFKAIWIMLRFLKKHYFKGIVVLLALFLTYAWLFEAREIHVMHDIVTSNEIPAAFDGFKIAFITDLHHGTWFSADLRDQVVKLVEKESPDMIVFGGDYTSGQPDKIAECFEAMKRLSAPFGMFGVLGNHDGSKTARAMQNAGIKLLDNDALWIEKNGQRIRLGGIADILTGMPSMEPLKKDGLRKDDFAILISHNPDYLEAFLREEDQNMVDLMLSGHTHGGQITFFGLYAPKKMTRYGNKYLSGVARLSPASNAIVITSNGVGTVGLPLRFFAPPQIRIVELKKH